MFYILFALKVEENGCHSATFDDREKLPQTWNLQLVAMLILPRTRN
jgi:hypothetical protein